VASAVEEFMIFRIAQGRRSSEHIHFIIHHA
jgi:hypothetical protein